MINWMTMDLEYSLLFMPRKKTKLPPLIALLQRITRLDQLYITDVLNDPYAREYDPIQQDFKRLNRR